MQQTGDLSIYAEGFEKILETVVLNSISTETYCKRYLTHLLQHKKYYIAVYADVLKKLLRHSSKNKSEIILVDYGAGNGLLGLFAKFCGFKKVFINDIDANFIYASQMLAGQLNIHPDGYIHGDVSSLQYCFEKEIPDAIVGTDVIEHIYDLRRFFKTLKEINPAMLSVFTTASNPENHFKVRALKKLQAKDELQGGIPGDMFGEYPVEPYIKIRHKIIRKYFPGLPEATVLKLSEATRGKIKEDIIRAVHQYKLTGIFPLPPAHKTNTCNPLSGSWTERILSLNEYILLYKEAGFTAVFYAGFYNAYEGRIKKIIKIIMNAVIFIFGKKAAPYILIGGHSGR